MYVTNNNDFDYQDRYNGNDYTFPAGQSVGIEMDVARHIFGVGDPDKSSYLVRSGWAKTSDSVHAGYDILNRFIFSDVPNSPATGDTPAAAPSVPPEVSAAPIPEAPVQDPAQSPSVVVNTPPIQNGSSNLLDKLNGL